MLYYIGTAAFIALVIFLIWWFDLRLRKYKGYWHDLDGLGIPRHVAKFKKHYTTPQGVDIISTVEIPEQILRLIDNGLNDMIRRSKLHYPDWKYWGVPSAYHVLFIDPMAYNEINDKGSPAIVVRTIQAAGTGIGWWPRAASPRMTIVLPHQAGLNWGFPNYLFNSVANEGAHFRALNDPAFFDQHTGIHTHPMYPEAGFAEADCPACAWEAPQ